MKITDVPTDTGHDLIKNSFFDDVKAFHQLFSLPVGERPAFTNPEDVELRMRLIDEERNELEEAILNNDIVEVADALADLIYVACGAAVSFGIPLNEVWNEVQRTNMAKVGKDGRPSYRPDGKVSKPEGWQPPDIRGVIARAYDGRTDNQ